MEAKKNLHEQIEQLNRKMTEFMEKSRPRKFIPAMRAREVYGLGKTFFYELVKTGVIKLYRIPGTKKVYVEQGEMDAIFEPTEPDPEISNYGERA